MRHAIAEAVARVLEAHSEDVQEFRSGLKSFEKVRVEYEVSDSTFDAGIEIDCYLKVLTPEGPGPPANCWILGEEFWNLFDRPVILAWIKADDGDANFLQFSGEIDGIDVTVNLYH